MPLSCGAAASTTPRTKARGATRGRGAALDPPLPVGGPGGSADEAPQRLDQQGSDMNESYARKLRQFMAERASERLQSHRRVVQLEVQLEGAIAHRGRAGPGPPDGSAGGGCGAMPDAAESYDGGMHMHMAEAEAASSYAHRLAQLAADRSREEQRHLDEIARLRTQVRGGGAAADGAPPPPAAAMAAWQHESLASLQLGATYSDSAASASYPAASQPWGGGGGAAGGAAEGARQQARERQQRRLAELERHVSVLQAGGVASELGRKRLARLQAELLTLPLPLTLTLTLTLILALALTLALAARLRAGGPYA